MGQAAAFYRDVAADGAVWTIRDSGGYSASETLEARRAQPFWSSRRRAETAIENAQRTPSLKSSRFPGAYSASDGFRSFLKTGSLSA